MSNTERQWSREEVYDVVADAFVEALGVELEEVELKSRVIDDLGAESLDFLDIAIRLERNLDVKIPRGDVQRRSQENLEGEFEVDGVLTPLALQKLKEVMPEVDPAEFHEGMMTKDIPRLFLVETFYNTCLKLIDDKEQLIDSMKKE